MRVVFFGTPDVAAVALRALLASRHEVVAVVTQPDKARARGRRVSASPVKSIADEHGLTVLQPASPKDPGFATRLGSFRPHVLAVVAYGHILPRDVLAVAPAVNVHFSLLPKYRGAAPVQRALMDGATETGVSLFLLEPTVDTGPILKSARVAIADGETAGELLERLGPIGAQTLIECIDGLEAGSLIAYDQADHEASPAPKIRPEETEIDWTRPTTQIVDLVRALSPRPGAHTTFRGKRLVITRAHAVPGRGEPGTVTDPIAFAAGTGDGMLQLDDVTPEGKRPMTGADFARGARPKAGERLGEPIQDARPLR